MLANEVGLRRRLYKNEKCHQTAMADSEKEDLYRLHSAIEEKSEGEIQRIELKY